MKPLVSGFDAAKLGFAFRSALIACLALLVATWLKLEHPQWAAMTVWITAQPTRGLLIEKALWRVAGTVSGTSAGVLLVLLAHGQPWLLVGGLTVWVVLCAGVGNLQRGLMSYGTILAGYSAAMVALLDTGHPEQVWAVGADRLTTILVGVLLALAAGLLSAPRVRGGELARSLNGLTSRVRAARTDAERYDLLSEMAAIEEGLDPHGAGSLRSRAQARAARSLLMALMPELLVRHAEPGLDADRALNDYQAVAVGEGKYGGKREGKRPARRGGLPAVLHRDWIAARWAMARAALGMLLASGLWAATGWHGGPFLLLGMSAMITLFSTFENPGWTLRFVVLGQICGALAALACRFLVWPYADNEIQVVLLTMPFILAGAPFFAHRRAGALAFDYAMVSLILLRPAYPLEGGFADMAGAACAIVLSAALAFVMFCLVFPLNPRQRLNNIVVVMRREARSMAAGAGALTREAVWRARFYHRVLRLIRLAERSAAARHDAMAFSAAVLDLADAVFALRRARPESALDAARAVEAALIRISK